MIQAGLMTAKYKSTNTAAIRMSSPLAPLEFLLIQFGGFCDEAQLFAIYTVQSYSRNKILYITRTGRDVLKIGKVAWVGS
jgi:hypothetical protein